MHKSPNKVKPGIISPINLVPEHIIKPLYVTHKTKDNYSQNIELKNEEEIEIMREACKIARKALDYAQSLIHPMVTTDEIDKKVHNFIIDHGAYPSTLLYEGFPKSICTSVNHIICHGIPDSRELENGDIINIDVTVFYKGFHGDVSKTFGVGHISPQAKKLMEVTKDSLYAAIKKCGPYVKFPVIGREIERIANKFSYNVVQEFCGHGIGRNFHGLPQILHFENEDSDDHAGCSEMLPGLTFTIEPILKVGSTEFREWPDKWTIESEDQFISAQFEHTILILDNGVEILTASENEKSIFVNKMEE
eukprot:gene10040-2359_t